MIRSLVKAICLVSVCVFSSTAFTQSPESNGGCPANLGEDAQKACIEALSKGKGELEQEMVRTQERAKTQVESGAGELERHERGPGKGSGGSPNMEGKSGPAGNKSKPQKQGH